MCLTLLFSVHRYGHMNKYLLIFISVALMTSGFVVQVIGKCATGHCEDFSQTKCNIKKVCADGGDYLSTVGTQPYVADDGYCDILDWGKACNNATQPCSQSLANDNE